MATIQSPGRLTDKVHAFDVLPIYRQEPEWQWISAATELSLRDYRIFAGRRTLGTDLHPCVAVTNTS